VISRRSRIGRSCIESTRRVRSRYDLRRAGVLVLLIAAFAAGCDGAPPAGGEIQEPPRPVLVHQSGGSQLLQLSAGAVPGMTLSAVQAAGLPGVLQTTGQITFDDRRVANIISRVAGRIEQVYVSQWDTVRRGQSILLLYSPDFMTAEAEYLQAEAAMPALAAGSGDNSQFARSLIEAARRKLELLGIETAQIAAIKTAQPTFVMRAPIGGTVVQNQALRGSAVNPGDVLYSVGTLADVWITGDIFEDDLARVRVGQELEATTTAYPGDIFRGLVERISPTVDPNTHTLQLRCRVQNPAFKLKPQMLALIRIMVQPGTALVVPQDALVFDSDSYFAYVDAGGDRFERRRVVISSWNSPGYARVIAGLAAGDRVVTGESLQVDQLWHEAQGIGS
jgi:Cu(I)/Ag(I) efflux system membrane fusion protein